MPTPHQTPSPLPRTHHWIHSCPHYQTTNWDIHGPSLWYPQYHSGGPFCTSHVGAKLYTFVVLKCVSLMYALKKIEMLMDGIIATVANTFVMWCVPLSLSYPLYHCRPNVGGKHTCIYHFIDITLNSDHRNLKHA